MGEWVWTWRGVSFGYIDRGELRTHHGLHVGYIHDNFEIYGKDGYYLGEIKSENRLITDKRKVRKRKSRFTPKSKRAGRAKRANRAGRAMIASHEDFPHPDTFR